MPQEIDSHLLNTARDLGTWLYRYRVLNFMTQREMAGEYGVARSTYSMWEIGDALPSPARMAALIGYHPEYAETLAYLYLRESSRRDAHQGIAINGTPPERKEATSDGR